MNDNYNLPNVPQEGTQEHDEYMRSQFGEDYELGYRVGFGRRLGAFIIDFIFNSIIGFIVMLATGVFSEILLIENPLNNIDKITLIIQDSSMIAVVIGLIYYSMEVLLGASIGKMLLGIKIASSDRSEASTSQLLNRYLLKHSNSILSVLGILLSIHLLQGLSSIIIVIIIIGFFFTLGSKRQALHDMLTNTAVYYKDNIKNY
ncbi:MAG: hypothetical protein CVV25_12545 [Ignavibacteriae bacterium HGW-Ignavibacteriae-4]|jgi:uncharacterized RDD family membrane protein YckC|nr:MAG: hypothetical protein CVV25_12545 [Ignavibacteriae bacterium HGW-Ignavibacteriae-4]